MSCFPLGHCCARSQFQNYRLNLKHQSAFFPSRNWVDVLIDGFCFRLVLFVEKELAILQAKAWKNIPGLENIPGMPLLPARPGLDQSNKVVNSDPTGRGIAVNVAPMRKGTPSETAETKEADPQGSCFAFHKSLGTV